jgi:hypothetical protein
MKEKIISGVLKWLDTRIDTLANENIVLALASTTIKKGASNWLNSIDISPIIPFITDKNGAIDVTTTVSDVMQSLKVMPVQSKELGGGFKIDIGNGSVILYLPNTSFVQFLSGGLSKIKFEEYDFLELADYINQEFKL